MDITRNWEENYFGLTKSISCFLANRRKIRCHFRYTEILYLLCITVLSLYGMQFLLFTQSSILKLPTRFVDQHCSPAPLLLLPLDSAVSLREGKEQLVFHRAAVV